MNAPAPASPLGSTLTPRSLLVGSAAAIVGADFWLVLTHAPPWTRAGLGVLGVLLYLTGSRGRFETVGLCRPRQPLRYWIRITAIVGAGLLAAIGVAALAAWVMGQEISVPTIGPDEAGAVFLHMCVVAPLLEESIYRLVLCVPLAAAVGSRGTIVAGGVVFAGLHVAYGNPAPDNVIAGFLLTWAFLKSGSLAIPLTWHTLGNACAFVGQRIAWEW